MKRFILLSSSLLIAILAYSQKMQKVSATYTYYAPETMSVEEAKRTALERAKIQAIADEFGTVVSQSNSTVITNQNGESNTQFVSFGGSDVKGEWIETIGEPTYTVLFENHYLVVSCTVKGKIREIIPASIDFDAKILCNGVSEYHQRQDFIEGDDFFLFFKSPHKGYLTVYLVNPYTNTAFCILPYRMSDETLYKIERNKDYIFFSSKNADKDMEYITDEYNMVCTYPNEIDELYLIFSEKAFIIPNIDFDEKGLKILSYQDFQRWITKLRQNRNNVLVKKYSITINKK